MKNARIYDFAMAANGSFSLNVEGENVRIMTSAGALELVTDGYRIGPINAGQGQGRSPFKRLTIIDKSGLANKGTILIASADFIDDRITGEVSVIDGGRSRSLAGLAFMTQISCTPVVGELAMCQIWNPAASGKHIIISRYGFATDLAGIIVVRASTAPLTTNQGSPPSKRFGSAASVAEGRSQSNGAPTLGAYYIGATLMANSTYFIDLREPVVVPPGYGFFVQTVAVTAVLNLFVELTEEAI